MRKVLFIATLFAFIFTSSVWAADVSGNWTLKMSGRQGEESIPMVIKAAGENLTVTGTHPMLQAMEGTGTIKGDDISFNLKATGQMPIEFVFTGKVKGDEMSGTREVKMAEGAGRGGAPGGQAPAGGEQAAAGGPPGGGQAPAGGEQAAAGVPPGGGQAPAGGEAPAGGPPSGGQAPAGGQQGGGQAMSNEWTAVRN